MAHCPYCGGIFKEKGMDTHIRRKHPDKLADWKQMKQQEPVQQSSKREMTLIEKELEIRRSKSEPPHPKEVIEINGIRYKAVPRELKNKKNPTNPKKIPETQIREPNPNPPLPSRREQRRQFKQLKREDKARRRFAKMDEKTKHRYAKAEEKEKEQFFGERHPAAYQYAKTFLPRLHTFGILIAILYFALIEMMKGNYAFPIDWYQKSYIFPAMVEVFSSQQALDFWWTHYGVVFIIIMMIITIVLVVFYLTIWRVFFKNYYKRSENAITYEGRCYWRMNNSVMQWWDKHYHSPERKNERYWLKVGWWPPLNIFSPANSLICIETTPEEKCEHRGIYTIIVAEKPNRRKVWDVDRLYKTTDEKYESGPIPIDYVDKKFENRSRVLVENTNDLSFGNAEIRNEVMRDSLRLGKTSIRRRIVEERKRDQQEKIGSN